MRQSVGARSTNSLRAESGPFPPPVAVSGWCIGGPRACLQHAETRWRSAVVCVVQLKVAAQVTPARGDILVFPHGNHPQCYPNPLHEGSAVRGPGQKLLIRTDVIYCPASKVNQSNKSNKRKAKGRRTPLAEEDTATKRMAGTAGAAVRSAEACRVGVTDGCADLATPHDTQHRVLDQTQAIGGAVGGGVDGAVDAPAQLESLLRQALEQVCPEHAALGELELPLHTALHAAQFCVDAHFCVGAQFCVDSIYLPKNLPALCTILCTDQVLAPRPVAAPLCSGRDGQGGVRAGRS